MLYPNEIGFEPAQEVLGTDHLPRVAQNCRRWNLQVLEVLTPEEVATCYNLQPYPIPFYIHLHTHNTPRVIKHRPLTSQRCATSLVSTLDWQMQVCTSLK